MMLIYVQEQSILQLNCVSNNYIAKIVMIKTSFGCVFHAQIILSDNNIPIIGHKSKRRMPD